MIVDADKDKAIEELLDSMDEEFLKGARTTLTFLRREGIICNPEDNCGECSKVDKFLKKLEERVRNSEAKR